MTHPFMEAIAHGLAERGIATLRYQFPYMEQGSKRPDSPKLAQATVRAAVRAESGAPVTLGVRPEHLAPDPNGRFAGTVELFERLGPLSFAHLGAPGLETTIVAQLPGDRRVTLGETLRFGVAPDRVHVFAADGRALPRVAASP